MAKINCDVAAQDLVAMLKSLGHSEDAHLSPITPGRLVATVRPPGSSRVLSLVLDVADAEEI